MGITLLLVFHSHRRSEKRIETYHKDLQKDKGKGDPQGFGKDLQKQSDKEQDCGLLYDILGMWKV